MEGTGGRTRRQKIKNQKIQKPELTMALPNLCLLGLFVYIFVVRSIASEEDNRNDAHSSFSRAMASQLAHNTAPSDDLLLIARRSYPEPSPDVCLAFLSCCGRTDLLNHTLYAAIRHMEEDEPSWLKYEIAWVDNGSGSDYTSVIEDSYQIEHALPLAQNGGLAYGMNLLIFNLCTAPYILLLEEDWLYLDRLVVDQTPSRKRAIATAIALTNTNITSFDGRQVLGTFLRPETYASFMKPPYMHDWAHSKVSLSGAQSVDSTSCSNGDKTCDAAESSELVDVDYQIFCADTNLMTTTYVWGSYTNGAGLYQRNLLMDQVGRMYGEPGDAFHDRYVEVNYAYRVGRKYCHMAIGLGDCRDVGNKECTAAFYHIGGGRGTRPRTKEGTTCAFDGWTYYGTPLWDRYVEQLGNHGQPPCSKEELRAMRDARTKETDAADYRKEVQEENQRILLLEQNQREKMRIMARQIRAVSPDQIRQQVRHLATASDAEIAAFADHMEAYANSPHPLQGFYDSHGRPLV